MRRRTAVAGSILAVIALLLAYSPIAVAAATSSTVTVFAAASLKNALDAAVAVFEEASGTDVAISYAATSTLAKQIEAGAPADLFVAANEAWMDYLDERGLIAPDSREALVGNTLVLIAPANEPHELVIEQGMALAEALGPDGRLAIANPGAVPAGIYGKAALQSLAVWDAVRDRLAPAQNVRAALALVAHGETPFGIVYASDARAEPAVRVVDTFPPETHDPIVYPAAQVAASSNPQGANLLDFLATSPDAARAFERQGFEHTANSGGRG